MLKSKHKKINNSIVHIKGDARRHKFKVLRWMTSDCTFFRLTGCITHWHTEVISGLQYLLKAWLSTKPGVKGSLWQFVHAEASSWWCNLKFSIKYIFKIFYLPGFPNRIVNFKYRLFKVICSVDRFICIKRPPDGALESQQSPLRSPTLSHTFCTSIFVRTLTDIIHSWATFPWTYYQQDGAVPQTHPWVLPWVTDI